METGNGMGFLQVLLLILKILGILIASVLALVLIATVLLLFVPLRYRVQGHKAEDYAVEARLSWLLRIIRVKVRYASETKLFYEVRLLWFLLLSNDEAWKTAHEEKKKKKAEKKARKAEKKKQKQKEKRARAKAKQRKKRRNAATIQRGAAEGNSKSVKQLQGATQKNDEIDGTLQPNETKSAELQEQINSENENQAEEILQQDGTERKNWFVRICDKIKAVIDNLKRKFQSILNTVKVLWHKADIVITFLKDETNKAAFGASWSTLVQILKHIGPTKIQGYLVFGMDDPATTGYILAGLGIFYSKFGKSFNVRPNFEEKQFETELMAKGRVRMSRLLRLALKLWKNKEFKSLLGNIKQLKTDIKTSGG